MYKCNDLKTTKSNNFFFFHNVVAQKFNSRNCKITKKEKAVKIIFSYVGTLMGVSLPVAARATLTN